MSICTCGENKDVCVDCMQDKIEELQAQLARCVVELKNAGCWLDSLNELPKIVHLDAEVLRCAEELYAHNEDVVRNGFYVKPLFDAVRAKREASNDNI